MFALFLFLFFFFCLFADSSMILLVRLKLFVYQSLFLPIYTHMMEVLFSLARSIQDQDDAVNFRFCEHERSGH